MARKDFNFRIPNPFYRDEDAPRRKTPQWFRYLIPNPGTIVLLLLLLAVPTVRAGVLGGPLTAPAAAPSSATSINYQGRLFDQGTGNPITGAVNLEFVIYDAATGGNVIWGPEAHNSVTVNDGLFDVALGDTIPLSPGLFGSDRWLETTVGGETLSPRQQLLSVPVAQFALQAQEAMGVSAGAVGSREFAPTIWVAATGPVGPDALITGGTPRKLFQLTVEDADASSFLIWWTITAASVDDVGEDYGRLPFDLYVDGSVYDHIWAQSASSNIIGTNTRSITTLVAGLTPGQPHEIAIYSHESGPKGVFRSGKIVVMALSSDSSQDCADLTSWGSPTYADAFSGATNSDASICTVFNP